jgi:hypothetical protein
MRRLRPLCRSALVAALASVTALPATLAAQSASAPPTSEPARQTEADAYTRYELLDPGSGSSASCTT